MKIIATKIRRESWSHYDMDDVLVWDDCNLNAFAEQPDGTVWIGASGGLLAQTSPAMDRDKGPHGNSHWFFDTPSSSLPPQRPTVGTNPEDSRVVLHREFRTL